MLSQELKEYVSFIQNIQSETDNIEVKAANKGCPTKLYDTLSSFSNRPSGGVIIFGLDEEGNFDAVGVYDADDLQKQVKNQCNEMIPKIRAKFTILNLDDKQIVAAEIPEILQEEKPSYYQGAGIQKGSYIRVGDSDEHLSAYEIYNLMSYRKRTEEDLRVIDRGDLNDLDRNKLQRYVDKVKEIRPNFSKFEEMNALEKLGIVKKVGTEYKPTLAAILCFGVCPDLLVPQLVINAAVIPGFNIGETGDLGERFLDSKKIIGTIPEMIKLAVEFIIKNMKKKVIIRSDNGARDDKYEYPVNAIREAVINALIHRDYSVHTESSYISIRMFNDRMEISNPGGLYGNITVEEINNIINPPVRNRNMVRILEEMEEIENKSSGIATMINSMRELKLEPPVFEEKRENFKVTFKNHNLMTKEDKEWLQSVETSMSENQAYALVFMRNNIKLSNGDYQKINNVNRDRALIELKELIAKGVIKSLGIGSGTYYVLSNCLHDNGQNNSKDIEEKSSGKVAVNDGKVAVNDEKVAVNSESFSDSEQKVHDYISENGYINNLIARDLLSMSQSGARKLLRRMADKNLLITEGNFKDRIYKNK